MLSPLLERKVFHIFIFLDMVKNTKSSVWQSLWFCNAEEDLICPCVVRKSHRIITESQYSPGWKGTYRSSNSSTSPMGRDTFDWFLRAPSRLLTLPGTFRSTILYLGIQLPKFPYESGNLHPSHKAEAKSDPHYDSCCHYYCYWFYVAWQELLPLVLRCSSCTFGKKL